MPAGIQAAEPSEAQKNDAQLRREAAKAQLDAENAAEREEHEGTPSLSGTTAIEGDDSVRASEDTAHDDVRAAAVHTAEVES